ncbi:tetraspanin-8 [Citrus sinensis]|uniref:Tetraspanin-8 n=1 Tax=Citrus sinensis TaxID=2711 RepID=A0ACB8P8P6_CITSI|nr:tetraspanin-8 [Citrus sinensis]
MFRLSNNLIGILNILTFLLSIPILWAGIWLSNKGVTECEKFLDKPVIILGVFLMIVSLAGLIGACCRISWLLWVYLVVMFLLIVLLFCFTIMAFVVTNKGAGEVLSGRGYKEYRLGDYSDWLQKRVNNTKNWNKIKSCLIDSKVCSSFHDKYLNDTVEQFYSEHLSSVQSGCCKPSNDCGFNYAGPTQWTKGNTSSTNPDCGAWGNDASTLCYNCQSCKAGLLDQLKSDWKKVAIVNIVFLIVLIIVYSIGCCAFRNSRRDNDYGKYPLAAADKFSRERLSSVEVQ